MELLTCRSTWPSSPTRHNALYERRGAAELLAAMVRLALGRERPLLSRWASQVVRWQCFLSLAWRSELERVPFSPGRNSIKDGRQGVASFRELVARARRHRRVHRLRQHTSALELTQALSQRGRIDRTGSASHLVEAEWALQQGLDDQQAPLFLEQHDGCDEAGARTAGV